MVHNDISSMNHGDCAVLVLYALTPIDEVSQDIGCCFVIGIELVSLLQLLFELLDFVHSLLLLIDAKSLLFELLLHLSLRSASL